MSTAWAKKRNFIFVLMMALLLGVQLLVLVYYGNRKAGFHEDELYTYYSSNKTAGLFVNDRQWMERDALRNDFVVLPGEGFRYQVVKQMQSWDVHPPFYYYLFHTACSLFPGVFSKWLGIGVNLIGYIGSYLLLAYGVYTAVTCGERAPGKGEEEKEKTRSKGRMLALLTCLGWGFSGAVISGVMFIRMYQWLTFFVLLCLGLHLRAVKKGDFRVRTFFLPLALTVFLGFLTQYYYIIFHFFLALAFCFWLIKSRKVKEVFAYGAACGAGFVGAVLYYPASMSHILRGYRGTEAVSEFSDVSNTWERLRFFYGLFDDYVMNGTLSWWLLGICLFAVTYEYLRKKGKRKAASFGAAWDMILFACAGYFFTVSKTALLLGETSNRYQLPIYGLLLFLILYGAWTLLSGFVKPLTGGGKERTAKVVLAGAFGVLLLVTEGLALKSGRVFFLYEEEREAMSFVQEHREDTVVVFYNEASSDHIWWLSDELMEYERVYLASQGNQEPITDRRISESDRLLVYAADHENREASLELLLKANPKLSRYQMKIEKGLWTLYELK